MKIKTKLQVSIILTIILAITIGLSIYMAIQSVKERGRTEIIAAEIVKGMAELNIITHEYLLHPEERSMMQWQSRYDSLIKTIPVTELKRPKERIILNEILQDLSRFKAAFTGVSRNYGIVREFGGPKMAISPELRNILIGELLVKSQASVSPVFQFQKAIQADLLATHQRAGFLVAIFLIIFTILIITISLWINRSIRVPIAQLERGTQIIGAGNLDHKVGTDEKDEIGQLSRAFDRMTDDLKKTTASIVDLNGEIDERKQAEEALRESEEKYRDIFNNVSDFLYFHDLDGNFLETNLAWKSEYGFSEEDLSNLNGIDIIPERYRYQFEDYLKRVKENGKDEGLLRVITKDGSEHIVEYRNSLVYGPTGPIVVRGSSRDITEQRRLQTLLQQTQKMEAIATLAGGIAHEFNNTLVGITGNIDLLQMDLPGDENIEKYTQRMKDSAHRMARLTEQLLAYARGGKYQAKNISLTDFVQETLPWMKQSIDPSIRIETDLPHDILNVEADSTQMQMMLSSILKNSAEAIEGKGRIRIITRNEEIDEEFAKSHLDLKPGPYVSLTIQDDGKGMDEETRSRIFDPFFTTKFQGRGLGMAAVYGIVKNHDGWITVDSQLDKGTMVRIYLPAVKVEVKEEPKPKMEPAKDTGTILVIEDEEVVIDVICAMLERLGYSVLLAETGKKALDIAKSFDGNIDLAILDVILPDLPGKEVYRHIMEARPNLKVIVCSGYASDGPPQEILDTGAQDFIQKPFSVATLSEKLKQVLEGK